ncbi:MAG: amino acid ABC transporter substrate-binding protein [Tissierellia bacterium]|nr:amino acid ABC transporter substrate-binding protein [Tissierellia bacterium]
MKLQNIKIKKILLMLFMILSFCSCQKADDQNDNEIRLGFDEAFPPMGFRDENGEYTGFDIELAKAVAEKLNYELKLVPIAWDSKDAELQSGNINCIWNGFTKTGREDKYTFSKPYTKNRQVIVVKKNSNIKKLADLKGKRLEVQADSTGQMTIEENEEFKNSLEITPVSDFLTALNDLEQDSTDAILMDEVVARYNKKMGKNIEILDEALSEEDYAIGFKKGNEEFKDKIQKALDEIIAEGKASEISKKYFDKDIIVK